MSTNALIPLQELFANEALEFWDREPHAIEEREPDRVLDFTHRGSNELHRSALAGHARAGKHVSRRASLAPAAQPMVDRAERCQFFVHAALATCIAEVGGQISELVDDASKRCRTRLFCSIRRQSVDAFLCGASSRLRGRLVFDDPNRRRIVSMVASPCSAAIPAQISRSIDSDYCLFGRCSRIASSSSVSLVYLARSTGSWGPLPPCAAARGRPAGLGLGMMFGARFG